jgi:hypothetical protein
VKLLVTLGAVALVASSPVRMTIAGSGHTPRINTHWPYTVRVYVSGVPARALLTMQIVDPIGGVHPVQFGRTTKNVTNWPIKGVFRDYIIWPAESRGIRLKLRAKVVTAKGRASVTYAVVPR